MAAETLAAAVDWPGTPRDCKAARVYQSPVRAAASPRCGLRLGRPETLLNPFSPQVGVAEAPVQGVFQG